MQIAVKPRFIAGISLLGLLMAIALSTAPAASAANLTCRGHTSLGQATDDYDNPLDYAFSCTGRILGYTLIGTREFDAFDTEIEVHSTAGAIIPTDGFACEGDIPGNGFGCFGFYAANGVIQGNTSLNAQKACQEPRPNVQLVVVAESIDLASGVPKKTSNGAMAGPFDLGRPRGCPKSSLLGGLLAEVALMRKELRTS